MSLEQHVLLKLANGELTSSHLIRSIMSKFRTTQDEAVWTLTTLMMSKKIRYDIKNEQNFVSLGSMTQVEMENYLFEMKKLLGR